MSQREVFVSEHEVKKSKIDFVQIAINKGVPLKEDGTSKDGYEVTTYRFGGRDGFFYRWKSAHKG